jgi:hypothetical protein
MSLQQWERRVHNFFIPSPRQPVRAYIWLGVGLFVVIIGVAAHAAFFAVIGLIAVVVGVIRFLRFVIAWFRGQPKATGQEIDAMLYNKLAWLVDVGANRLGVHPTELGPHGMRGEDWHLDFVGIPVENLRLAFARPGYWRPDKYLYIGWGEDGCLRLSRYRIMIVYKSNYRMPVYECTLDIATGATVTDVTQEYTLQGVEGLVVQSDRINVQTDGQAGNGQSPDQTPVAHFTTKQVITLMVSGRPAISLTTGIASSETSSFMGVSQIDGLVAALREHLRQYRFGARAAMGYPGAMPAVPMPGMPVPGMPVPGAVASPDSSAVDPSRSLQLPPGS